LAVLCSLHSRSKITKGPKDFLNVPKDEFIHEAHVLLLRRKNHEGNGVEKACTVQATDNRACPRGSLVVSKVHRHGVQLIVIAEQLIGNKTRGSG